MSKFVDCIIGHAIGDAMGVPTEFCIREKLLAHPVTEMIGSEKTGQPAGSWSDDTSMELATMVSLTEIGKFDYDDIMSRWVSWIENNEYTSSGKVFDVGRTCLGAIRKFSTGTPALECGINDIRFNGNGSIMRMGPIALYAYTKRLKDADIKKIVNEVSSLTHPHEIARLGCYIYVKYLIYLLRGDTKEEAYIKIQKSDYKDYSDEALEKYQRILKGDIKSLKLRDIKSSVYVVDTLECALWILLNADNFRDVIIASTNIGQDTDTIGGVAGACAGVIYGIDAIPKEWLDVLARKDYLIKLAKLFEKKING